MQKVIVLFLSFFCFCKCTFAAEQKYTSEMLLPTQGNRLKCELLVDDFSRDHNAKKDRSFQRFFQIMLTTKHSKAFMFHDEKEKPVALFSFVRGSWATLLFPNISSDWLVCLNTYDIERHSVLYAAPPLILVDDPEILKQALKEIELYAQDNQYEHIIMTISEKYDLWDLQECGFKKQHAKEDIWYWHKKIA